MLLCAARAGYSFDFRTWNVPFFIEPSVEINLWPIKVTNIINDHSSYDIQPHLWNDGI